jgi:hypothetical protein
MLKHQMFGRTCHDLLSRRFVLAPGHVQDYAPTQLEPSTASAGAAAT